MEWDAENYGGQINPQITDADGMYSWYVPDGYWKVKFTKDGYTAAETEWMEVPPPKLDVNIGLISTAAPARSKHKRLSRLCGNHFYAVHECYKNADHSGWLYL